jgi:hypothetical protein
MVEDVSAFVLYRLLLINGLGLQSAVCVKLSKFN